MNQPLLVLDTPYLCHRLFHVGTGLQYRGRPTDVIFGFLRSIAALKEEFRTDRVAFCFEHPHLFRQDFYPAYKQRRRRARNWTREERKAYDNLSKQILDLKIKHLPRIGFKNCFCFFGMESDDIMAQIARSTPENEETVLVTSDSDLYQCLSDNVSIYSPQSQRLLTKGWFKSKYGISPFSWRKVKALSGCSTDEVPGIKGIGELTALRYLRRELEVECKAVQLIASKQGRKIYERNLRLVALPHESCPVPRIQKDEVTESGWREVCNELGMHSIAGRPPIAVRRGFDGKKRQLV